MATLQRSFLVDILIVLALALVAVIGYLASPLLLPKSDVTAALVAGCDLNRGICAATLADGERIELSLSPRPVPVVRPMGIEATLTGFGTERIDNVEIDFAGVTMNMGYNRVALAPAGAGRYTGEATIPVCVSGRMTWRATLIVTAGRRTISVPFPFDAPVLAEEQAA